MNQSKKSISVGDGTDGYMPPLGSFGEVVGPVDHLGAHEVLSPRHPCPAPPGVTWEAHASWLVPVVRAERTNENSSVLVLV